MSEQYPTPPPAAPVVPDHSERGFRLYWWAAVPLVLVFVLVIVGNIFGSTLEGLPDSTLTRLTGSLILVFLIVVVPAWLAYLLSRRSKRVGSIVCVMMSALFLAGVVVGIVTTVRRVSDQRAADRVLAQLDQQQDRLIDDIKAEGQKISTGEEVDDGLLAAKLDEYDAVSQSAARELGDTPEGGATRVDLALMRQLRQAVEAYRRELAEVGDFALLDAASMTSRDAIAAERAKIDRIDAANDALTSFFETFEATARAELLKQGAPPATAAYFASERAEGPGVRQMLRLRQLDRELMAQARLIVDHLDGTWGRWHTADDGSFVFDREEDLQRFDALAQRFTDIADQQVQLATTPPTAGAGDPK